MIKNISYIFVISLLSFGSYLSCNHLRAESFISLQWINFYNNVYINSSLFDYKPRGDIYSTFYGITYEKSFDNIYFGISTSNYKASRSLVIYQGNEEKSDVTNFVHNMKDMFSINLKYKFLTLDKLQMFFGIDFNMQRHKTKINTLNTIKYKKPMTEVANTIYTASTSISQDWANNNFDSCDAGYVVSDDFAVINFNNQDTIMTGSLICKTYIYYEVDRERTKVSEKYYTKYPVFISVNFSMTYEFNKYLDVGTQFSAGIVQSFYMKAADDIPLDTTITVDNSSINTFIRWKF